MSRLTISNIAWPAEADDEVGALLRARGLDAVELAPTTRWPDLAAATPGDASHWRAEWEQRGLRPVALQSLLYGRPELSLFGDDATRLATQRFLAHVMTLAGALGAGPLVFGSPANRRAGELPPARATDLAAEFFAVLGPAARAAGVVLCIEPNPPQYGCDFLTDTASCVRFLALVDDAGIGLHLDAGALVLNDEPVERAIEEAAPWLRHYHASEPFLAPLATPGRAHRRHAAALASIGYRGLVSIEMRRDPAATRAAAVARVAAALDAASEDYAPLLGDPATSPA